MTAELHATADLHPRRIHLEVNWNGGEPLPPLQLVRRQQRYPVTVEESVPVVDLADLFHPGPAGPIPWERIETRLYLLAKTPAALQRQVLAEQGILQAQTRLYFAHERDDTPVRATVTLYNAVTVTLEPVSRLDTVTEIDAGMEIEHWEFFNSANEVWGRLTVRRLLRAGHGELEWRSQSATLPSFKVAFDRLELHRTRGRVTNLETYTVAFQTVARRYAPGGTNPEVLLRNVSMSRALDPDRGDWNIRLTADDRLLDAERLYYYALFAKGENRQYAAVMATGYYGLDERLYGLLPSLHQQYDEPTPEQRAERSDELHRFVQIFGAACDQLRSLAEGLRGRHDLFAVQADWLPHLANLIGWAADRNLSVDRLRHDILFAPEVFATVGTVPHVRALFNRVTGQECQVKEFVHNIFLSNAPEPVHLWELWGQRLPEGASAWEPPKTLTHTDGFDGRPVLVADGAKVPWLIWHSDRSGRRELWLQRLDQEDAAPRRVMEGAPDDGPQLRYTDEYPAAVAEGAGLRLFWCSNRDGYWNIWTRTFDGSVSGAAEAVTDHPAEDRNPAVVRVGANRLWLFWQSNRRGPTDIWAQVREGRDWATGHWEAPTRITTAIRHHEMPAAVCVGDDIWLFWSDDQGDRSHICAQVYNGSGWGAVQPITTGAYRNEAPAAVSRNGAIWLYWHSNQDDGRWRIWNRNRILVTGRWRWNVASALTAHPAADKEPAALVEADGALRLVWRSQRRGERFKSRTVDTKDPEMLQALRARTFDNWSHYTYDTGTGEQDWYSRGTVGLYASSALNPGLQQQLRAFLEPFRLLQVRFLLPSVHSPGE